MAQKERYLLHAVTKFLILALFFSPLSAFAEDSLVKPSEQTMPVSYGAQTMIDRQTSAENQIANKNDISLLTSTLQAPAEMIKAVLSPFILIPQAPTLSRIVLADGTTQYFDSLGRISVQVSSTSSMRFLYNADKEMTQIYVKPRGESDLKQTIYDLKTKQASEEHIDGSVYTYSFISFLVMTPNMPVVLVVQTTSEKILKQKKLVDGTMQYFQSGRLVRQENNDVYKTIWEFSYNSSGEMTTAYKSFGITSPGLPKQIVYSLTSKFAQENFSNGDVYAYSIQFSQPSLNKDGRMVLYFSATSQRYLTQRRLDNGAIQYFNVTGMLTRFELNDASKTMMYFLRSSQGELTGIYVVHYQPEPGQPNYIYYDLVKNTAQAIRLVPGSQTTKSYSFRLLSGNGDIMLAPDEEENARWSGNFVGDNKTYVLAEIVAPSLPPVIVMDPDQKTLFNQKTVTVHYIVDGVAKLQVFTDLKEGVNSLSVSERNAKGLQTILNFDITVDTIVPAVVLDSATETQISDTTFTVNYTVDGVAKQMTFEDLSEGFNALTITEVDLAGNRTEFTFGVTVQTELSNWFDEHMNDSILRDLGHDLYIDGLIDRNDMLDLFNELVLTGTFTADEFFDLQLIANTSSLFGDLLYVSQLTQNVVLGSIANANYQGAALGNLTANSTINHLGKLVSKWFLGTDRPQDGGTYMEAAGSLFVNGVSREDIRQGNVADCYLMASLAQVADRDPSVIQNMFIDNGDGTFTVQFYWLGKKQFFTVDRYLPTVNGALTYASAGASPSNANNELWVSLAEKAYVQASEIGWNPSLSQRANSYGSINGGYIYAALGKITGEWTVAFNGLNFAAIKKAFDDGNLIGFASKNAYFAPPLAVPSHAYSMVGYDEVTQTIKLYNPWGTWLPDQGVLTLTMSQLAENFQYWDRTTGVPGLL